MSEQVGCRLWQLGADERRSSHNPKVAGSNPAPAPNVKNLVRGPFRETRRRPLQFPKPARKKSVQHERRDDCEVEARTAPLARIRALLDPSGRTSGGRCFYACGGQRSPDDPTPSSSDRDHGVLIVRKLIAWVFMYSPDGLLADEGTECWQFCFGLPITRRT